MSTTHLTYVVSELLWACPVLAVQWIVGRSAIWGRRRELVMAILISTIYLAAADSVAIANGIWFFRSSHILTIRIGNVPIEEVLFFLLTNAMVVQSVILVAARLTDRSRAHASERTSSARFRQR